MLESSARLSDQLEPPPAGEVRTSHLLLSLAKDPEGIAGQILATFDTDYDSLYDLAQS